MGNIALSVVGKYLMLMHVASKYICNVYTIRIVTEGKLCKLKTWVSNFGMLPLLQICVHVQLLLSDVKTIHQSCFSVALKIICEVFINCVTVLIV